nr:MAG TPA: hypothetical protein [Caudoviricetes sp.]
MSIWLTDHIKGNRNNSCLCDCSIIVFGYVC